MQQNNNKDKKHTSSSGKYCHGKDPYKTEKKEFGPEEDWLCIWRMETNGFSWSVAVWLCFNQNGKKKGNKHQPNIYVGTRENGDITDFMLNFSDCDKMKFPVDP